MPLSDDAAELAKLKYIENADLIIRRYAMDLDHYKSRPVSLANSIEIDDVYLKQARELAENWISLHIDAYMREESLPNASDISKMGHALEKLILESIPSKDALTDDGLTKLNRLPIQIYRALENQVRRMELEKKTQQKIIERVKMAVRAQQIAPDGTFSFVADSRIKAIIERDYAELQELTPETHPKSVLILCGGIIEGLLIDALVKSGTWTVKEANERFLKEMIHPAKNKGIIKHDNITEVLRVFWNIVHPAREIRDNLVFTKAHASHAKTSVDVMIAEVRQWHKDNP
jgi:hypothetical protein